MCVYGAQHYIANLYLEGAQHYTRSGTALEAAQHYISSPRYSGLIIFLCVFMEALLSWYHTGASISLP